MQLELNTLKFYGESGVYIMNLKVAVIGAGSTYTQNLSMSLLKELLFHNSNDGLMEGDLE